MKDELSTPTDANPTSGYAPFETLRYDPTAVGAAGEAPGFVRLDRHLARLERSSEWLGLELDRVRVVETLRDAVAGLRGAQRVRFTITDGGRYDASATPLPMSRFNDTPEAALGAAAEMVAAGKKLPRAAVASQRIDESDPARAHKTTARELYYAAREVAERLGLDDVLFFDGRDRLAEGSISSVFVVLEGPNGREVLTPPLSSGALPGVMREELLERGLAEERDLYRSDLDAAAALLLGSSVRGLRRVSLQHEPVDVSRVSRPRPRGSRLVGE